MHNTYKSQSLLLQYGILDLHLRNDKCKINSTKIEEHPIISRRLGILNSLNYSDIVTKCLEIF